MKFPATLEYSTGAIQQDEFDIVTPWHAHECHQLQYAFEGALIVEDAGCKAFLPRQLAAWIPAGTQHRTSLHKIRSVSVMFDPSLIANPGTNVRIIPAPMLLRELIREAVRWPVGKQLDAKGQLYFQSCAMFVEEWISQETPLLLPTFSDARVSAAMEYTRQNLTTANIETAARIANMSVRTLRRKFHVEGMSWDAYRRRSRLLAAIAMLDETSFPMSEIAARVGYENQGAFTKVFHELLGQTPTAFRNRYGKDSA